MAEKGFDANLALLHAFAVREGHARVPKDHVVAGVRLGLWVATLRQCRARLPASRISALEAVPGWTWQAHHDHWERKLAALRSFAAREGHTRVPDGCVEAGFRLGRWVARQRAQRDAMAPARIALLEAVPGWSWEADLRRAIAEAHLVLLRAFAAREGHALVPKDHVEAGVPLGTAVARWRRSRSKLALASIAGHWPVPVETGVAAGLRRPRRSSPRAGAPCRGRRKSRRLGRRPSLPAR